MSKQVKLLPLGSAVKTDKGIFMIAARGLQKQKDGSFLAGYKAISHPMGLAQPEILITEKDIVTVLKPGYEDAEDEAFSKSQQEKALKPPIKKPEPEVEPNFTIDLKSKPAAVPSKPTQQPEQRVVKQASLHPKDPFYNLRRRGK
ncbi:MULTISPECIES: DUF4176 domain-containing protein [unclassified Enterococcus]|uniref:DUF4176 domain-containing protein n=1 Tax=unclassified Enterococcus TaxID=2608891 RepID=UPI0015555EAA|nr:MULTISPECIES: DUF4176 domain-containing protein [unclassified Enterococcus]MBS7576415.1 DUF4176 domain-containing protein [Enterococcus sp. MMGLQ5-2]MBS7583647.1 DUF4176 domain-containing protein [Enterococcus sp. MMGLQ5-1]NPD11508.1 DUF4176 domain-containing protein [Enterococcus sp. MMGLQ5-1]NPD36252.1 DUF4176 domain-containing protein [Enterococcus sp. MMGLQ5-2]